MNNYIHKKLIESFLYSEKVRIQVLNGDFDDYITSHFISFLFVYSFNYEFQQCYSKNLIIELKKLINYVFSLKHNLMLFKVNDHLNNLDSSNQNKISFIEEINKRLDIEESFIKNKEIYFSCLEKIKKSFDYDFEILNMILMDEEKFNHIILDYQVNEYFFYSLNALLKEDKELLNSHKQRILKLINLFQSKNKDLKKLKKNIKNNLK